MISETHHRSIRILIDLQACQTVGSHARGVGRYARALFAELCAQSPPREIFALVSTHLPFSANVDTVTQSRVLPMPPLPNWPSSRDFEGGERDTLDALALSAYVAPVKPDIIHVSHVFEGCGDRVALPSPIQRVAGQVISATLYDLIPLRFQDHYFQDTLLRKWYLSRLNWLHQVDLLLAISESTRQDAIGLLGIEPWRIVTIHSGVSAHFRPLQDCSVVRQCLRRRYGLRDRFALYTGGDDHRKNMVGAIKGYAAVPLELRRNCQLVIICAMEEHRREMHLEIAKAAGLADDDVIITGFVPEEDLVAFLSACDVFVFPSLYEGLGLPVLEAMACGAPVLGGNNSSIRELIDRPDALFDAASPRSIGDAIASVLGDDGLAGQLREHGLKRSRQFSWKTTAEKALAAFDEALTRVRHSGVQCTVQGWVPRKRIAVFTPLPPCRSGIAEYNARFLPYLSRHFNIDLYVDSYKVVDEALTSAFRIFEAQDFDPVAQVYDAILYEFGNSEFHAHMLPLLEKYPGIVGLHDAYLSGLFQYVGHFCNDAESFRREMITAHGPLARSIFLATRNQRDADEAATVTLPCSKRVLDHAIGLISHSAFNLDVARQFYPEGWQAPYRIIRQMVPVAPVWTDAQRRSMRAAFEFAEEDLIVATFGYVAWTKWGDRLLEAFLGSSLSGDARIHLIFAGDLAKDDFGLRFGAAVKKAALGKRLRVTGFLSNQDYEGYLRIADVAVQLRTKSRGGTPKAVLDCLAHGVPVVVNNDSSYTEYPDDVVIKLSSEPSVAEIAGTLETLCADRERRLAYADAGLRYVRNYHDPEDCAARYAAAIHEFMDRQRQTQAISFAPAFAPHLASCPSPAKAAVAAAEWLEKLPAPLFARRRLFIDVTHIAQSDHQTGIPRVVKEIVRSLYCSGDVGFEPVAVELKDGALEPAITWLSSQGLLLPHEQAAARAGDAVLFRPGDLLLMLDSSWARYREFFPVFGCAREARVPIYTAVYDLLPLTLPPGNIVEGGKDWFAGWLQDAVAESDGLICISRAVADDLVVWLASQCRTKKELKIGFWHLGADFSSRIPREPPSPQVAPLLSKQYLLMVGTIDPRKSHALALDAMERLWNQGHEVCLCVAGKEGWMVSDLMKRMRSHPLRGERLFLIEGPTDDEMDFLYVHALGLLFISIGEGFGLPLVEAANHGIPIVCSDIPVFREIASDYAFYVSTQDVDTLVENLENWLQKWKTGDLPDTRSMPRLTWEQSGEKLLEVVLENNWYRTVNGTIQGS